MHGRTPWFALWLMTSDKTGSDFPFEALNGERLVCECRNCIKANAMYPPVAAPAIDRKTTTGMVGVVAFGNLLALESQNRVLPFF